VTAREGALKLREAARMLAEGFDAEYLLHGSAVPLGPADGLVLLEPDADRDGLVAAIGEAAAAERVPVSTLSLETDLPPVLAQIPMTVVLQRLAASWARLRAQDPDVAIVGAWAEPTLWELGS
jgi:glucosamine--fructose-6-phosphate aminotransferase (isomerizing)